jgi:hypothetical protein
MRRLLAVSACSLMGCVAWAQGGFNGPGRYEISSVKSGKVLDLDRNDQTTVIQFSSRGTDNQTWEIRPASGGFFYLRNGMNGYALDAGRARNSEPLRGVPFNGGDTQQWRFDQGKDGNVLIISKLGPAIDIPDGSDRDGVHAQVYDPNGDSNQRFALRMVNSGRGGNWDRGRDWNDRGGPPPVAAAGVITCGSNNGGRVYCETDTRNGVSLSRQISGTPCVQDRTWGYDNRGIWVDRGCRAEFTVNTGGRGYSGGSNRRDLGAGPGGNIITCASNNGERVYCEADTRGGNVQLTRQISGTPCREGQTWGWDRRGIWVDRGCRAEFVIGSSR